jgi:hypothetical protein
MSDPNSWPEPRLLETDPPRRPMSDKLTAWVRTVVPALWSALVAWLVSLGLPPAVTDAIASMSDEATMLVVLGGVPAVLSVVYAALRWLELRMPAWLARILLGSIKTPNYDYDFDAPAVTIAAQLQSLDMVTSIGRAAEEHAKLIRARE